MVKKFHEIHKTIQGDETYSAVVDNIFITLYILENITCEDFDL